MSMVMNMAKVTAKGQITIPADVRSFSCAWMTDQFRYVTPALKRCSRHNNHFPKPPPRRVFATKMIWHRSSSKYAPNEQNRCSPCA